MSDDYRQFLEAKSVVAPRIGFDVADGDIHPILKPHQRAMVRWLVAGGRRACFAAFGLGKTLIDLECVRLIRSHAGGMGLIVAPLGVRQEFMADASMIGLPITFVRTPDELHDPAGIYITNYETVRDGKLDPQLFGVVALDEAACLRGFGGTKTFREFMATMAGDDKRQRGQRIRTGGVPYRLVFTATPSPNEYLELLAYAAFLGIMDVGQAKTRFFKRDSEKADQLTIHAHKEAEFWAWVASWALFVQRPSDLGFSDEGYVLPELDLRWHELPADHRNAGTEKDGQGRLFADAAIGVSDAARVKRDSLPQRLAKLLELRQEDPAAHRVLWHDLESEREAIERALPECRAVYGNQDLDEREALIADFSHGRLAELAAKPVMLGSGCNLQRHCSWAIYLGIGFKFADFIQSIHRLQRFLQTNRVRVDLIYTEAERRVRASLERKWKQHNTMVARMTDLIRQYGLAHVDQIGRLTRAMGVERIECKGQRYTLVHDDCVLETRRMASNSVDLICTSIPFSTQYEYSPNYADFGHTDDPAHFWRQMDFLVPELLRVLKPGRVAAIHVKDRIQPGGINGLGFQTVDPFSDDCLANFRKHGFAFLARKTIVTDVVRENNQTYRLGWSEQCKDGSRMGAGMPEYFIILRKPPTDSSNGYADLPVAKDKAKYTRPRWQFDAHGYARSSGNRRLQPEELDGLPQDQVFQLYKKHSLNQIYDFRHDVRIAEHVDAHGWLPTTFMLLQPQSWHPDVWADVVRMRGLNTSQAAKGKEGHLCPLPFDIVERAIEQYSMPGEVVYDPFAGLGTVPERAVKLGRIGRGCELSKAYWLDACGYCKAAEEDVEMPDLFSLAGIELPRAA